jgi:5-methyltetrahydrofolate--homocysteine methyltransferase
VTILNPQTQSHLEKFTFLRQQKAKETNYCLADYIAPANSGKVDYLGVFAVTVGSEVESLAKDFERKGDDYTALLVKAIGDRLAEATTEYMHRQVRTFWGYGREEKLSTEDLIREKYQGIRPAPGYPACPDHRHKQKIWKLLDVEKNIGATLTESCAIYPPSSVSGFYFSHPQSKYFHVGRIGDDQVNALAAETDASVEMTQRWLAPNL